MLRYYPHEKTSTLRAKILKYTQGVDETFYETYERFKLLLIQCPHHNLLEEVVYQSFYDGLTLENQTLVDNAAGGSIGDMTASELTSIFEILSRNSHKKGSRGKSNGVFSLESQEELVQQVNDLTSQVSSMSSLFKTVVIENCLICGVSNHNTNNCPSRMLHAEQVNAVQGYQGIPRDTLYGPQKFDS